MPDLSDAPLSDRELAELDDALAALPDEREPLDVAMLDGFLTGIALFPVDLDEADWMPWVFDAQENEPLVPGDAARAERVLGLVRRHRATIAAHIAAREAFDPYVVVFDDEADAPAWRGLRFPGLGPWALGFAEAIDAFPLADDDGDDADAVDEAIVHIIRHLPVDPDDTREAARALARDRATIDADIPLDDLEHAVDELMASVMAIADITRPRVPVERDGPKVGRNDPCPCGSGKKYKQCHGREAS